MARTVNENKRLERREAILKEAVVLFGETGYSNTTMSSLAKNVGITAGTIFQYFSSKEDLYFSAVLEPLEDIQKRAVSCLQQEESPDILIKNLVNEQFNYIYLYTNELRLIQSVLGQPTIFPELTRKVLKSTKQLTDKIERVYSQGQRIGLFEKNFSPKVVSRAYISLLNGVGLTLGQNIVHKPEWDGLKSHAYYLFAPLRTEKK